MQKNFKKHKAIPTNKQYKPNLSSNQKMNRKSKDSKKYGNNRRKNI